MSACLIKAPSRTIGEESTNIYSTHALSSCQGVSFSAVGSTESVKKSKGLKQKESGSTIRRQAVKFFVDFYTKDLKRKAKNQKGNEKEIFFEEMDILDDGD